jgi:hypothetical protein
VSVDSLKSQAVTTLVLSMGFSGTRNSREIQGSENPWTQKSRYFEPDEIQRKKYSGIIPT